VWELSIREQHGIQRTLHQKGNLRGTLAEYGSNTPGIGIVFSGNDNDAMNMVRHDDELIEKYMREMCRNVLPALHRDGTRLIRIHDPIDNFTEDVPVTMRRYGQKICSRPSVVISAQTV
jgi:hypothetical protein